MKRTLILAALATATVAGFLRVQLVARDDETPAAAAATPDEAFLAQVRRLSKQLDGGEAELAKLREALQTEEGLLVMRGRAEAYVWEEREAARSEALPRFIEAHFEPAGDGFRLRADQQAYRQQVLTTAAQYEQDIARIAAVLRDIGSKIQGDDEADQLLARFMASDAAGPMIYIRQLRSRVRVDLGTVEEALGKLLAKDAAGRFTIRAGRRAAAEETAEHFTAIVKLVPELKKEVGYWVEDLAEPDELHRTLKKLSQDDLFISLIAARAIPERERIVSADAMIHKLVDGLDEAVRDTLDGLVFREEAREEVQQLFDEFRRAEGTARKIKPMLQEIAGRMTTDDELHRTWAELLKSDLAALKLGHDIGEETLELGDAVRALLGEVIRETDDGRFEVIFEDTKELDEFVQDALRQYRQMKRRGRRLDEFRRQAGGRRAGQGVQVARRQVRGLRRDRTLAGRARGRRTGQMDRRASDGRRQRPANQGRRRRRAPGDSRRSRGSPRAVEAERLLAFEAAVPRPADWSPSCPRPCSCWRPCRATRSSRR